MKIYTTNIHSSWSIAIICILIMVKSMGCKKFIQVETPVTNTSTESAFKADGTATAVITSIYSRLSSEFNAPNLTATSFYTELSGDNLSLFDPVGKPDLRSYYLSDLDPGYADQANATYWKNTYSMLYTINTAVDELTDNSLISENVRKRLLGEAYFLRAFCYFYLVNLYGEVPLVLSPNHGETAKLPRRSVENVYSQINSDLSQAEGLLDNSYRGGDVTQSTTQRLRPNLYAVYALQARVFLYQKNYAAAETAASKVITQSDIYSIGLLNSTFSQNSSETIWALQSVTVGYNTRSGAIFILPAGGPDRFYPVYLSNFLIDAFEAGDDRKNAWIGNVAVVSGTTTTNYSYAAKYKIPIVPGSIDLQEHTIVLRLAEQYLIRAEARNEQNNTTGAIEDLNVLRRRARGPVSSNVPNPLPDLSASLMQPAIRNAVIHERQVELFTEWGHRWFDLKRSATIDAVMTPVLQARGGTWSSYKSLYPIPATEIRLNPALSQNPGYTN